MKHITRLLIGLSLTMAMASGDVHAALTLVGPSWFSGYGVVGVNPVLPGQPALINFDILPDGSALPTPFSQGSINYSSPITNAYASAGVLFDGSDIAVSQPINPLGIGVITPPNTLSGGVSPSFSLPVSITFTTPVTAAGITVVDGPTNDTFIQFFDTNNQLIHTIDPLNTDLVVFAGIESDVPIGRMTIATTAVDDYYAEDLYYIPVPEPASAVTVMVLSGLALRRRRLMRRCGS